MVSSTSASLLVDGFRRQEERRPTAEGSREPSADGGSIKERSGKRTVLTPQRPALQENGRQPEAVEDLLRGVTEPGRSDVPVVRAETQPNGLDHLTQLGYCSLRRSSRRFPRERPLDERSMYMAVRSVITSRASKVFIWALGGSALLGLLFNPLALGQEAPAARADCPAAGDMVYLWHGHPIPTASGPASADEAIDALLADRYPRLTSARFTRNFPGSDRAEYRLQENGRLQAIFNVAYEEDAGWHVSSFEACNRLLLEARGGRP